LASYSLTTATPSANVLTSLLLRSEALETEKMNKGSIGVLVQSAVHLVSEALVDLVKELEGLHVVLGLEILAVDAQR